MPCLTDQFISRLKQPKTASERYIVRDSLLAGFCIIVSSKSISFAYSRQQNKTRQHTVIGHYPFDACANARVKAFDLVQGKPIQKTITTTPKPIKTAKALLTEYANSRQLAPSTISDLVDRCPRLLGAYADKPATDLDQKSFEKIYRNLIEDNRSSSARLLARYISAAWNWDNLPNPTTHLARRTGIAPTKSNAKNTRLEQHQIPLFNKSIATLNQEQQASVTVAILTGLRRSELKSLTANNLCFDTKSILLSTTKSKKPHKLPVGNTAWSILAEAAQQQRPTLLQVADRTPKAIHDLGLSWHDLRRSCGSLLSELGADIAVVKRVLNHSSGNDITLKHYIHISDDTVRSWLSMLEKLIL